MDEECPRDGGQTAALAVPGALEQILLCFLQRLYNHQGNQRRRRWGRSRRFRWPEMGRVLGWAAGWATRQGVLPSQVEPIGSVPRGEGPGGSPRFHYPMD